MHCHFDQLAQIGLIPFFVALLLLFFVIYVRRFFFVFHRRLRRECRAGPAVDQFVAAVTVLEHGPAIVVGRGAGSTSAAEARDGQQHQRKKQAIHLR